MLGLLGLQIRNPRAAFFLEVSIHETGTQWGKALRELLGQCLMWVGGRGDRIPEREAAWTRSHSEAGKDSELEVKLPDSKSMLMSPEPFSLFKLIVIVLLSLFLSNYKK